MKTFYIILCFSINTVPALTPLPDIFDLIKTKKSACKLEELLSKDEDLCLSRNKEKQTPLMAAILEQNKELALTIRKYTDERSINIQDNQGNSALHYALMYNVAITLTLINKGAKIDLPNHRKETPIHLAATDTEKFDDILLALPSLSDIDLNAQDIDGNTALHVATHYKQTPVIQALVRAGVSLNIQNKIGFIPLHIAIILKHIPHCLLADTNSYNTQDDAGHTALHLAVLFHHTQKFNLRPLARILWPHTDLELKTEKREIADTERAAIETVGGETVYQLAKKLNKLSMFYALRK